MESGSAGAHPTYMGKTRTYGAYERRSGYVARNRIFGLVQADVASSALADGVIRCVPGEDHTNGFFVSCFVKKQALPASQNQKRKLAEAETEEDVAEEDEGGEEAALEEGEGAGGGSNATTSSSKKKKKNKRKKQKKGPVVQS
jgi:hypothetical protein